jgi:Fur family ferric uptake transcriptional regulator
MKKPGMQRNTTQRSAIQKVFGRRDHPMGVGEVLRAGRRTVRSLNQATVYRNLKLLVDEGWLRRINTPESGTLYERAGKEHHHHFQCRTCDQVFELSGCALNEKKSTPPGFLTEGHEVFFFGTCAECRGTE